MNKHCETAKVAIECAESTDTKMASYEWAAQEIEKAINDDHLTQQEVADQVGKSRVYVQRLLTALTFAREHNKPFVVDWQSGSNKRTDIARRTTRAIGEIIPEEPEEQAELAKELMADPAVVAAVLDSRSRAASNVRVAVSTENAERRRKSVERAEQERESTAMPVNSIFANIAEKLDEWSRALMEIEDDLIEARDQFGASIVVTALRMHADTCDRIADRIQIDVNAVEAQR